MAALSWAKAAAREHWRPLLILVAPINWVVWHSDAETAYPLLPLPLVALAVGALLRPRHVWFVWLASVVIEWVVVGIWGKYADPGQGETVASLMLEAFGWMAIGVLFPVWFGRFVRTTVDDLRQDLRDRRNDAAL